MAMQERGGKTRGEFLALYPQMADWLATMEGEHGLFERMGALTLSGDRHVTLTCFARAWIVSIYNIAMPREVSTNGELCFAFSPEILAAIVGLHTVLKPQDDTVWDTLIAHLVPSRTEVVHD